MFDPCANITPPAFVGSNCENENVCPVTSGSPGAGYPPFNPALIIPSFSVSSKQLTVNCCIFSKSFDTCSV